MNYIEALEFIHGRHKFGSKLGLDNIKALMNALGNPQKKLKFIHVAGTNGKGSTSSMIASVLKASDYRTGLYTSPFIEKFNERIQINGEMIRDEELAELTALVKEKVDELEESGLNHPTEFEVVTAIGMLYFQKNTCDIVVLEVGLGGRLDATNVIDSPLVSVITPIDLDHMEYLGNTYSKIAKEKAGIIKPNGVVVSYPQVPEAMVSIVDTCKEKNCTLQVVSMETLEMISSSLSRLDFNFEGKPYTLSLIAPYQAENAALAIKTLEQMRDFDFEISLESIQRGLMKTVWMARMEVISTEPLIIIDGAHNAHGISGLAKMLKGYTDQYQVIGVVGILKDKDVQQMLEGILPHLDAVITTKPNNPRALSSDELASQIKSKPVLGSFDSIEAAMQFSIDFKVHGNRKKMLVCFGSLYMVGDARQFVKRIL